MLLAASCFFIKLRRQPAQMAASVLHSFKKTTTLLFNMALGDITAAASPDGGHLLRLGP
jgi:hypothetical protein